MARRGPKPMPKHQAELRGSWRAKKRAEPEPSAAGPVCPDWLGAEGKKEWQRQAARLMRRGLWSEDYQAALTLYCESWDEFVRCAQEIRKLTELTTAAMQQHPLVAIRNRAAERVNKLGQQFGFSPTAEVDLPKAATSKEKSKIPTRPRK